MRAGSEIEDVRRALGLTARDEALVRGAVGLLSPHVEGWVDAFYDRLARDPVAMALIVDEARIVRLKRSLTAWFHEMFSLPLDAAYARLREDIGRTHVRIGMPAHLMVTAVAGLRSDLRATLERVLPSDADRRRDLTAALERTLDLELCLMLSAYARHARAVAQRRDRALLADRLARRFELAARNAVDTALCYAELARRSRDDAERALWATRLEGALMAVARDDRRWVRGLPAEDAAPVEVSIEDLCAAAVADVATGGHGPIEVRVRPPGLRVRVHEGPLRAAVAELLRNALRHAPGGPVAVDVRVEEDGTLVVEVTDTGPGWPPGITSLADALAQRGGVGLAYGELVAELHGGSVDLYRAEGGGAGVRLRLHAPGRRPGGRDADPSRHP